MDVWVPLAIVAIGAPFAYVLGSILGVLRACHKELVQIRLATVSLHDQVVPEVLTLRMMRRLTRR